MTSDRDPNSDQTDRLTPPKKRQVDADLDREATTALPGGPGATPDGDQQTMARATIVTPTGAPVRPAPAPSGTSFKPGEVAADRYRIA